MNDKIQYQLIILYCYVFPLTRGAIFTDFVGGVFDLIRVFDCRRGVTFSARAEK